MTTKAVKVKKRLLKAVGDPAYRAALGRASLKRVNGHSEEKTFQKYGTLYRGLVKKAREK